MYIFLYKSIQQYYMKINNYNSHNFSPFIRNMKKKYLKYIVILVLQNLAEICSGIKANLNTLTKEKYCLF